MSTFYEIIKHIGVIREYPTGWKKELNIVRWGENDEKFDIRDWDPSHEHMSRGVTLTEQEIINLMSTACDYFKNENLINEKMAQEFEKFLINRGEV